MNELPEWDGFSRITSVPTYDMETTQYIGSSMEHQPDGSGDWVPVDDVRKLLKRIAELTAERDALQRSIGALVRDGQAFYAACKCSSGEDELDERERFGCVLANYPEPDVLRWIEADEQHQAQRKAELQARYARVVASAEVIEAAKSLVEWEDSGEVHRYSTHVESLRRAIGKYDAAHAANPNDKDDRDD